MWAAQLLDLAMGLTSILIITVGVLFIMCLALGTCWLFDVLVVRRCMSVMDACSQPESGPAAVHTSEKTPNKYAPLL